MPLQFVRAGSDDDVAAGFAVAARLAGDADPAVHKPVGIYLKHAGVRDPAALRLAVEKLEPAERERYLG